MYVKRMRVLECEILRPGVYGATMHA